MDEYVKKKTVLERLEDIEYREPSYHHAGEMIKAVRDMPAADVRPVVYGEWIRIEPNSGTRFLPTFRCSVCGISEYSQTKFCPICGADMRKERDNG